jgi:ABC-type dipeptide/oligopeptide/nickel transport system permease component
VLFGVSLLVFLMLHLIPGDPVLLLLQQSGEQAEVSRERYDAVARKYGLDQPLPLQYLTYVGNLLRGDLGESTIRSRPVAELIAQEAPFTAELAVSALAFAIVVGVLLGVAAALNRGRWLDTVAVILATFGVAMPAFWFGLLAIFVFAVAFGLLPASGVGGPQYLVLPAVTLGIGSAAAITRLTRSSLLEALAEDYVRTARAKGLLEWRIVAGHALRNSLIPVVTLMGLQFGALLAGAVVTETVFARRGLGALTLQAVTSKDFPLAQGLVMFIATLYVMVNLVVDLAYSYLDPRIRYA